MSYSSYFSVLGAYADLALKQIVIETNFLVNPKSVTMDNILLYEVSDDNETHKLTKFFSLSLDETKKNIIIQFENYPKDNSKFYIIVKNLIDKLDRELKYNYDRYITFSYNIKTKVKIDNPLDQSVLKDNNVEFNIATSCEDKEIKYRIEISQDVAFFKTDYLILDTNKKNNAILSNDLDYNFIGYDIDSEKIKALITFKTDGQYYIRVRAEKQEDIAGKWSDIISFSITTAKSPMQDNSGFLNDFLYSEVLYEEDSNPLEELSSTSDATTNQGFYIEFNKNLYFEEDKDSQYTKDGLLYIGKAYMTRRDL